MDNQNKIKAVFFDIDDTLYGFKELNCVARKCIYQYLAGNYPVSWELFEETEKRAMDKVTERLGKNHPSTHNRQIRFQNMLHMLGIPIYPHANEMYRLYWDTVIENALPEDGIKELLAALKARGIYLGIGTDMTSYIQNKKLERLDIAEYFDCVVASEEVGEDKPSEKFFALCAERAGCESVQCLFIGDSLKKDVRGAKSVGMYAACYNRYSLVKEQDAGIVISSYRECIKGERIQFGTIVI